MNNSHLKKCYRCVLKFYFAYYFKINSTNSRITKKQIMNKHVEAAIKEKGTIRPPFISNKHH